MTDEAPGPTDGEPADNDDAAVRPLSEFEQVRDLARGFWASRILMTAAELELFTALAGQSLDAAELAHRVGARERGLRILADALVGLGLLVRDDGRYANTSVARRHLDRESTEYRGGYLRLSSMLWQRWSHLTDVVRHGADAIGPEWTEGEYRDFVLAMHHAKPDAGGLLVDTLELHGVRRVVDLGGGPGTFSEALARALPEAQVVMVDLPEAVAVARERLDDELLDERIVLVERDVVEEGVPLAGTAPGPYDLALLSSILHIFSPDQNASLLGRVFEALEPGGQVVIREFVADESRTRPPQAALFSVNMLVNTEAGRAYSFGEIRSWLHAAGFGQVERLEFDGRTELITARRA